MAGSDLPDARSGFPKPIERHLVRPYADTFAHRVGAAAAVRALGVLVRRHPRTAIELLAAAIAQAGRVSLFEIRGKLKNRLARGGQIEVNPGQAPEIDKRLLRKLRRRLESPDKAETPGEEETR